MEISGWSWWWLYNREPYLDLKAKVLTGTPGTGSDDFFLGHDTRVARESAAPDDSQLATLVGPALQAAIVADESNRIVSDAMIALAKLHPVYVPVGDTSMKEIFSARLVHSNQKVVESAVLALGLMADPSCASILCDIAADTETARRLLGREKVPGRTRPLAALAVGLIGARCEREDVRRYIVSRLVNILESDRTASPDLFVGCVTSIGLSPLAPRTQVIEAGTTLSPAASLEGQVEFLAAILTDRNRREFVRAHVPKALGLLVRDRDDAVKQTAARALLDILTARKKDKRLVRHGVVEGLGLVGDSDADALDIEIRKALRLSIREGDVFQRQLSVIALALVSSRPGQGEGKPLKGLDDQRSYLLEQLTRGKNRLRPWVALALGLQAFHGLEQGSAVPASVLNALRTTMEDVRSPEDVGAWCLALGLSGDLEASSSLLERMEKLKDDAARGRAAVALGLLGDRDALQPLREVVADSTFRPFILREGAIGLALLGDKQVIDDLLEVLRTQDSLAIQSAAVTALGFVADKRAIPPLVKLLEDGEQGDLTRAYAAIALGTISERYPLPWGTLYSCHFNYEAATETLITGGGTGILNMR
jgi:HEAT repeat protein